MSQIILRPNWSGWHPDCNISETDRVNIDSVDELQELFIRDAGKSRLVLLLSPT